MALARMPEGATSGEGDDDLDFDPDEDPLLEKAIEIDAANRRARVGGGCTWGEVDRATHGIDTPAQYAEFVKRYRERQ